MAKKKSILLILIVVLSFFAFTGLASCGVPADTSESISASVDETVSESTSASEDSASVSESTSASEDSASDSVAPAVNYTVVFKNGETEVASVEVKEGETVAAADIPADPVSDYEFYGWFNGETKFDAAAAVTAGVTYVAKFSTIKSEHIGEWRGEDTDASYNSVAYVVTVTGETVSLKVGAADAVAATNIAYDEDDGLTFEIEDEVYTLGYWLNYYYICNADESVIVYISLVYDKPVEFDEDALVGAFETEAGVKIVINSTFVLIDGVQGTEFESSDGSYSFYIGGKEAEIAYDLNGEAWVYSVKGEDDDIIETPAVTPVEIPEALIGNWSAVDNYYGESYYFLTVGADGVYMCYSSDPSAYAKIGKVISAEGNSIVVKCPYEKITISLNEDDTLNYLSDSSWGLNIDFGKEHYVVFCYQAADAYYADLHYAAELGADGKVKDDFALQVPEITDGRYEFSGWMSVEDNVEFNKEATFDKSIIFVGKAVKTKNAVTFKADGENDIVKYIPIEDGVAKLTVDLIPAAPALEDGENFIGWYNGDVKAADKVAVKDGDEFVALIATEADYAGYWVNNEKEVMLYVDVENDKLSFGWVNDASFTFENGVLTAHADYTSREKHIFTVTKKIDGGVSVLDYYWDPNYEEDVYEPYDLVQPELVSGVKAGTYILSEKDYLVISKQGVVQHNEEKIVFGYVSGTASELVIKYKTSASGKATKLTGIYCLGNIKVGTDGKDAKIYVGGSDIDKFTHYDCSAESAYVYIHKVGDENVYVYSKSGNCIIATVEGEIAIGKIITVKYDVNHCALQSVQYKITAAGTMIGVDNVKGEYTSETLGTLKLDGFGTATLTSGEDVKTYAYVINGAGVVLLKNDNGEIVDGVTLGEGNTFAKAEAVGEYGYFLTANKYYKLTIDGFGGATVLYSSNENVGTYSIGDGVIVINGISPYVGGGTFTLEDGGKVLVGERNTYIADGYTLESHIDEFVGYYVNGDDVVKIIVADGKATVLVNGTDVKATANYNGSQLTYTAKDTDSEATQGNADATYIVIKDGSALIVKHKCAIYDDDHYIDYKTEYTDVTYTAAEEPSDGLEGTYKYTDKDTIIVITLDGKGSGTYKKTIKTKEYSCSFTYSKNETTYSVSDFSSYNDGENTFTVTEKGIQVDFSGDCGQYQDNNEYIKETAAELDGLQGTYKAGSNVIVLKGDGTGTYNNGTEYSFTYTLKSDGVYSVSTIGAFDSDGNTFTVTASGIDVHLDDSYGENPYNATFTKQA